MFDYYGEYKIIDQKIIIIMSIYKEFFQNLSLASLCIGGAFNGIDNSFGAAGGPAQSFDVIGGTNNPITTTQVTQSGQLVKSGFICGDSCLDSCQFLTRFPSFRCHSMCL